MTNNPNCTSWLGKLPALSEDIILHHDHKYTFPQNFVENFNKNPEEGDKYIFNLPIDYQKCSNYFTSRILFYCPDISFTAITNFFLSNIISQTEYRDNRKSLFYFYFQSINLDYLEISDSARFLLSRVAIPQNDSHVKIILNAFGEAYCDSNKYLKETPRDISIFGKAAILYSMRKVDGKTMSREEFKQILDESTAPNEAKEDFMNDIIANPIPLFFTFFGSEIVPSFVKSGVFSKIGKKKKISKKKKYKFNISNGILTYTKESSKDIAEHTFNLNGILAEIAPAEQKLPRHIVIKRISQEKELPIEMTVKDKNGEVIKKKQSLSIVPENNKEEELISFINCIAYNSCYNSIFKLKFECA